MLAIAIAAYLPSCSHNHAHEGHNHELSEAEDHDGHDHEHEGHDHENEGHEGHNHEGEDHDSDEIVLKPETATRFGVETAIVTPGKALRSIKVSGSIITEAGDNAVITAPTAGIVRFNSGISEGKSVGAGTSIASISAEGVSGGDPNVAAKTRLDAAKRELDRVTPLHKEGIVSTRDYNTALAAYEEAKAAYSVRGAQGRATSPIAGAITSIMVANGQYVNAGDVIATVSANGNLVLRADLPEKYYKLLPHISDANVKTSYADSTFTISSIGGKRVTSTAVMSATRPGYIPVIFSFDNRRANAPAGAAAEVYLLVDGDYSDAITVPVEALSEQQGNFFVYVRVDEHGYQKTAVNVAGNDGRNVIIASGLRPGHEVVVKGASIVRMAETSSVAPEGHHHH